MRFERETGRIVERSRVAIIDGRDQHQRAEDQEAEIQALRAEVTRLRQRCTDLWTPSGARQVARMYPDNG
jgi:cell division protein FtsB